MRDSVENYIKVFEKTLNLSNICWWIIDFKEKPDYYFCNELMKDTFSLDKSLQFHSIEYTCPIAGDYNKNIELACETCEHARVVIDEYKELLNGQTDEYKNKFPYYSKELNKTLYFSSRAKVLERNEKNEVSILYGIIEDITLQELQKQNIEELSIRDKLTNLYNRVKIDEALQNEYETSKRYKRNFSLTILDIDYFKSVNDRHGHLVGDSVLIQFANILMENSRQSDIVGRWGGEEFIIISPNSDIESIKNLAEKLRFIIENFEFDVVENLTVSFGVSQLREEDDINSFIKRVDDALYKAKKSGRNRVEEF